MGGPVFRMTARPGDLGELQVRRQRGLSLGLERKGLLAGLWGHFEYPRELRSLDYII